MNDWIGPMGSSLAETPNLDRLAEMGMTFTNAHTAGVFCAPSRAAVFTGRYASTTGFYNNHVYFYDHPEYRPLQVAFQEGGYNTYGAGKLFHHPKGMVDQRGWTEFFIRTEEQKLNGWAMDSWEHDAPLPDPYPGGKYNQVNPEWNGRPFMEVGAIPDDREEDIVDTRRSNWASELLQQEHDKPFFIALGLYAPHYPNYAPQRFYDLYPLEEITHPEWKEDDLEDIPEKIREKHQARKEKIHDTLIELDAIKPTIQGYLASISYADANLGRVLDALEASPYKDNTIIVFWSDHGYAQGQKGHWGKHTLWERTSNVPFIWAGPGIAKGQSTDYTASLIDMYPTLAEMSGLPEDEAHEGVSLAGVLDQSQEPEERSVLLPYDEPNSYAVINKDWRYIQYADGGEELYDLNNDEHEWYNLAADSQYASIKDAMQAQAPAEFAPAATSEKDLELVTEGETYHWELKEAGTVAKEAESDRTADGWKPLFNGKDLSAFEIIGGKATYDVKDGTITGHTAFPSPNTFLATKAQYADFELEFDVEVSDKLNSGVQIRSRSRVEVEGRFPVGRFFGPQVEIEAGPGQAGYIYGEATGRGWLSPEPKSEDEAVKQHAHFNNGEWNHFRIVAKGARIQTYINGKLIADLADEEIFKTHTKGRIGFQVHGIPEELHPMSVSWLNIFIREL